MAKDNGNPVYKELVQGHEIAQRCTAKKLNLLGKEQMEGLKAITDVYAAELMGLGFSIVATTDLERGTRSIARNIKVLEAFGQILELYNTRKERFAEPEECVEAMAAVVHKVIAKEAKGG